MPRFEVRAHVHEVRKLRGVDDGGTSDPMVEVSVMGQKQMTEHFEKCTDAVFDKLFFYELNVSQKEWEVGKIIFKVYDWNMLTKNLLIGAFEFGTMQVHNRPDHEFYMAWVALINLEDASIGTSPQGFLKVSVSAVSMDANESHATHDEGDAAGGDDDPGSMVLMPPDVKQDPHVLALQIYKAVDLPKMDVFGYCDGYVKVAFGGVEVKTEVVKECKDPEWKEELRIPVNVPTMSDVIEVSLWDYDAAAADDWICNHYLSFSDVLDMPPGPHWTTLYGFHDDDDEEMIREARIEPTVYKGRVLLDCFAEPNENARMSKKSIAMCAEPPLEKYELRFDIFQVSEIPDKFSGKLTVEVCIGNPELASSVLRSKSMEIVDGACTWLEKQVGKCPTKPMQWPRLKKVWGQDSQIPDIFVNVIAEGQRYGYVKLKYNFKSQKFFKQPEIAWYSLKPDRRVVNGEVGTIQFRLQFGEAKALPSSRLPWPNAAMKPYLLRAHLYQARNLPAADDNGSSDPYLAVRCAGAKARTHWRPVTLNPTWYITLDLPCVLPVAAEMRPDVQVMLYDRDDSLFFANDFLGRFNVSTKLIPAKFEEEPEWWDVFTGDGTDSKEGQILASFQLIPFEEREMDKMKKAGKFGPYQLTRFIIPSDAEDPDPSCRHLRPDVLSGACTHVLLKSKKDDLLADETSMVLGGGDGKSKGKAPSRWLPPKLPLSNPDLWTEVVDITPPMDPGSFELFIVGIRKMEPYAMFDVQQPFIEADAGDLGQAVQTRAGSGPNANFMELVTLRLNLPKRKIFASSINLRVFEVRGPMTSLVGTTSIPISRYVGWDSDPPVVVRPPVDLSEFVVAEEEGGVAVQPRDYIPLDIVGMNEIVDSEHGFLSFSTKTTNDGGAGERTLPDVPDKAPAGCEDTDEEPEKKDDRATKTQQWEYEATYQYFDCYTLKRGQKKGGGGFFGKLLNMGGNDEKEVGILKCRCRITLDNVESESEDVKTEFERLGRMGRVVVRLYVIRGIKLKAMDNDGFSDPYVKVGLLNHPMIDDKAKTLNNKTNDPLFYTVYEFTAQLPGDALLRLEAWDEDVLVDELIGAMEIDIEDRWYSDEWHAMNGGTNPGEEPKRPKEHFNIWIPSYGIPQGKVECWLDMYSEDDARKYKKQALVRPKAMRCELRVTIWDCQEVVFRDKTTVDLKISGSIEYKSIEDQKMVRCDKKYTDIHWFSDNYEGLFNWRWIFPVQNPCDAPRLRLQIWDQEIIAPNDAIAEANIALAGFFKKQYKGKKPLVMDNMIIDCGHPNFDGCQGKIKMTMELLSETDAKNSAVGEERNPPNALPLPKRPPGSMNPFNPFNTKALIMYKLKMMKWYILGGCIAFIVIIAVVVSIAPI